MKKTNITFWVSTTLVSLLMLNSAYMCFASDFMKESIAHLGFPAYFRIELGITKILGTMTIAIPMVPRKVREFAYSGFFIMFTSGIAAHLIVGDPATRWGAGIVALIILTTSYASFQKLQAAKTQVV